MSGVDFMTFEALAASRQSCRSFDKDRAVEREKIEKILAVSALAPSACNGQPYHITVCEGETAKSVAKATQGMGMNKFTSDCPVLLVISEKPYVRSAAVGAKLKNNDYRSIDIGILSAYITAQAEEEGISSCILGWFDNDKLKQLCSLSEDVRLCIALGYPKDDKVRLKKRKPIEELVSYK